MTKKTAKFLFCAMLLALPAGIAGCGGDPAGPRVREIERFSEMSDDEIDEAKEHCHVLATTDYNCAALIPPTQNMTKEEWEDLNTKTKLCRKSQLSSYHQCLRGKGVLYSEFR
jgi:hypothetical protein